MAGGPSQFETFDYKPALVKYNGQPVPQEFVKDLNYAFIRPDAGLYASELKFAQRGQSGTWVSEALPYTSQIIDEVAVVKSAMTRRDQSCAGPDFYEHRFGAIRATEHRRMGDLWTRQRVA